MSTSKSQVLGEFTSADLNDRLRDIVDKSETYQFEAFGDKAVAYLGWYWRDVDLERDGGYSFGITPNGNIGFMENNKWDYNRVHATAEQWDNIRRLIVAVAGNPCRQTLKALNAEIQSLGD